jgi:hypothetical protein
MKMTRNSEPQILAIMRHAEVLLSRRPARLVGFV